MKDLERYIAAPADAMITDKEVREIYPTVFNTNGTYDLTRNLEDITKDNIIYRKAQIKKVLESDPDLLFVLNKKPNKPLNKFIDPNNPTDEELKKRKEIEQYNLENDTPQIFPWIKLNNTQYAVKNYICYDITVDRQGYDNKFFNREFVDFVIFVHDSEMETEFENITRVDLLSYILMDLLHRSSIGGKNMSLYANEPDVADNSYYIRKLQFIVTNATFMPDHGSINRYDRFKR